MAKRFLVTIALGTTFAIAGAGTASSITVGGVNVTVPTVPLPTNPLPINPPPTKPLPTNPLPDQLPGLSGGSGGGGSSGSSGSGGGSSSGSTTRAKTPGLFGKQNKKGQGAKQTAKNEKQKITQPALRNPDGTPADTNPSLTVAQFGPAPIGVPNFVIDSFEIPPFLLPIYQSCGTEYGIPWQVLASINKIETAFGTNLNVSSAGAEGWMQFIPSTWAAYGVDANDDGKKDPYNPVDAICAAARYLRAAGGDHDIRQAIFAYNHADWYVDEVLLGANQYGKLPDALIGSLTGLTEGAHFPVAADARYADDINDAAALESSRTARKSPGNAADVIRSNAARRSINIYSSARAPVVAVNDGVVRKMGRSRTLGRYIVLQDAYGNQYTYSQLGSIESVHAVPRQAKLGAKDFKLQGPGKDTRPHAPATAGDNSKSVPRPAAKRTPAKPAGGPPNTENSRRRAFALPQRTGSTGNPDASGPISQHPPGFELFNSLGAGPVPFNAATMLLKPLKVGSKVTGGTVIGRVGRTDAQPPHLNFAIRPAGQGAPTIDPKPILDGW